MNIALTPDQVAEHFQITRDQVIRKAMNEEWPCLRIGRRTIRFTQEQVSEIEELVSVTPLRNVFALSGHKRRSS